eukprot:7834118-Lingulodinium_polyedra.AAC.1
MRSRGANGRPQARERQSLLLGLTGNDDGRAVHLARRTIPAIVAPTVGASGPATLWGRSLRS